jgi:hypothetical protein
MLDFEPEVQYTNGQAPKVLKATRSSWNPLVLETSRATFGPIGNQLCPYKLDHASIVVAVSEVVVQSREAMALAG